MNLVPKMSSHGSVRRKAGLSDEEIMTSILEDSEGEFEDISENESDSDFLEEDVDTNNPALHDFMDNNSSDSDNSESAHADETACVSKKCKYSTKAIPDSLSDSSSHDNSNKVVPIVNKVILKSITHKSTTSPLYLCFKITNCISNT